VECSSAEKKNASVINRECIFSISKSYIREKSTNVAKKRAKKLAGQTTLEFHVCALWNAEMQEFADLLR